MIIPLLLRRQITGTGSIPPPGGVNITYANGTAMGLASSLDLIEECRSVRSIWSILWSCVFTLVACVWLSVHPNMPCPTEGWIRKTSRRMGLVLLAIIAPEYIAFFALKQRSRAQRILELPDGMCHVFSHQIKSLTSDRSAPPHWELPHGFFAVMGGFMSSDSIGRLFPAVPGWNSMTFSDFEWGEMTAADIADKGKGDFLLTLLVVLQVLWFILGLVSRAASGLAISQFEVITCGYILSACITYIAWWHKPYCAERYIYVERKTNRVLRTGLTKRKFADMVSAFVSASSSADITKRKRVPMLFTGLHEGQFINQGPDVKVALVGLLLATAFGGIHVATFTFPFPTPIEQLMWRISALCVAGIPLGLLLLFFLWNAARRSWVQRILDFCSDVASIFGTSVYVAARLVLLVLQFTSLRAQPKSIFAQVFWTEYLPHFELG
jgi:hypothetical protein